MGKGFGDRMARGGAKAAFPASEPGITEEKFQDAVKDFDSKGFLERAAAQEEEARAQKAQRLAKEAAEAEHLDQEREQRRAEERRSDALSEEAGVSSPSFRKN